MYSLATMAFEMLSGVTPFTGEALDIMRDKTRMPAPGLTQRMQAPWAHAVGRVLALALAQDPSARPSAGELLAMLRAIAAQTPREDAREALPPSMASTASNSPTLPLRSAAPQPLSPSFPVPAAPSAVPWAVAALTTGGMIAAVVALLVDHL